MRLALLALALAVTPACTAARAFAVTGDTIKATGRQYVQTTEAMIKGVDEGKISPSQFRAWAAFSDKFALTWDTTAAAWLRAREAKRNVELGEIEAAIAGIGADLYVFYLKARDLGLLPNLDPAGAQ